MRSLSISLIFVVTACTYSVLAFTGHLQSTRARPVASTFDCPLGDAIVLKMTGWSDFQALDDDDDDWEKDFANPSSIEYADENDTDSYKRMVGEGISAPSVENDAEPIFIDPIDGGIELSTENLLGVLSACRQEIPTMFGYQAENRGVGITGSVDYVDRDGPVIILRLKGRFWHERTTGK